MGGFLVYDHEEIEGLSKKQRETLRDAIHKHLRTSPEIRKILRAKTRAVHRQLTTRASKGAKTRAKPKARRQ